MKLLRKHHLRPAVIEKHRSTMHASSSSPAPMAPLHLAANTLTLRTSSSAAHGPSRPPHTLPRAEASLFKRRLQGGHDADGAAIARPASWTGFSPQDPMLQDTVPHSGASNGENDAPRAPSPLLPTRVPVKAFARMNTAPYARSQTNNSKQVPRRPPQLHCQEDGPEHPNNAATAPREHT